VSATVPEALVVAASPVLPVENHPTSARATKRPETPLLIAVRHATAGRLAEAAEAYRALGTEPGGAVYAELAAILARRASAACTSNSTAQQQACPEVLK